MECIKCSFIEEFEFEKQDKKLSLASCGIFPFISVLTQEMGVVVFRLKLQPLVANFPLRPLWKFVSWQFQKKKYVYERRQIKVDICNFQQNQPLVLVVKQTICNC